MNKNITLKGLFRKFSWKIILIILLVFLSSYLTFIIRFNLINNLRRQTKGYFYYLFGRYSLIEKIEKEKIFINWSRLLFILFILYFPFKIIIKLTLYHYQTKYEQEIKRYLNKKINNEYKNIENPIFFANLNNQVTTFSNLFIKNLADFFEILVDAFFILISLIFILKNYHLPGIISFLIFFSLIYLAYLGIFHGLINNLPFEKKNSYLIKIPYLVTFGTGILFLFTYCNFQREVYLNWGTYFTAYILQLFLLKMNKIIELIFSTSNLIKDWKEISPKDQAGLKE